VQRAHVLLRECVGDLSPPPCRPPPLARSSLSVGVFIVVDAAAEIASTHDYSAAAGKEVRGAA
jgi:hypothetical protein